MTSTATYDRGVVVVVGGVPFSNGTGFKARPALVVSTKAFHQRTPDILVCPINSQPRYFLHPGPGDYPLRKWRRTGLRYPSSVRISKLLSIDKRLVKRGLKKVSSEDLVQVEKVLRSALGL